MTDDSPLLSDESVLQTMMERTKRLDDNVWNWLMRQFDKVPLWALVLLVGLPLLGFGLNEPMQSRFEPVDAGRTMHFSEEMMKDPFGTCEQPLHASSLWPDNSYFIYCGMYWGGFTLAVPLYIPVMLVFGNTPVAIRSLAISISLLTAWLLGTMVHKASDERNGKLVALLWLFAPMTIFFGWHYHSILITLALLPPLIWSLSDSLRSNHWRRTYLLVVVGVMSGWSMSYAIGLFALVVLLTKREQGGLRWLRSLSLLLIPIGWFLVNLRIVQYYYPSGRTIGTSPSSRRTTWELLTDPLIWTEIGSHGMFLNPLISLTVFFGMFWLIRFIVKRGKWSIEPSEWGDPRYQLGLFAVASGSIAFWWLTLFLQAVYIHEWFLYFATIPGAILFGTLLSQNPSIRGMRFPLVVIFLLFSSSQMYLRYQEEPLRPFSADWQNWMINNTDEDDVLLVSSSLVEFDSGPVWSCQGEMIAFSQNLDGSKLIDYVDEHDEVTMVVIPWYHERDEGIRSEFEDRGWSREVQHNYMGGYLSWIIHHRPT